MRFLNRLGSVYNLALRSSTLIFRFALSFYVIKYLGYEASGIYGLAIGAVGIIPALIGWGFNYFMAREVVGATPDFAAARIKSRLFVTTISLALATAICVIVALATGYQFSAIYLLIVVLVWLETYALDFHLPLIALEMAVEANVLVFLRSALWVPFVVGLGIVFPNLRNLETVFAVWILSYVVTISALIYFIRHWPLAKAVREPIQYSWITHRLRHSGYIYISDLSIVGLMYADRYIVSFMLGLTLTGVYTFYWSLTNALQTLMATALIQPALPVLFKAHNSGSVSKWRHAMRQQLAKTLILSTAMGLGVFFASEVLIHLMSMSQLAEHRPVFILLLLAAIVRSYSDLFNIGLTSMKKDNYYATINLIGVCLSVAMATVMILAFGFMGTGIAALTTAVLVAAVRAAYLVQFTRSESLGEPRSASKPLSIPPS